MARSTKKGPYVDERIYRKVMANKGGAPLRVWNRACTIVPEFIGHNFDIHTGKTFVRLYVTEEMVGHKLGEFAPSRTFRGHTAAKKAGA